MKKILLIAVLFSISFISCKKTDLNSGPTYCWKCVNSMGEALETIPDKTEAWAKANADKYVSTEMNVRGQYGDVCHELLKTECR